MVNARPPREISLDLCGLKCPLPALKARRALAGMQAGDVLAVAATDQMAAIDIPHMIHETRNLLLSQTSANGVLTFTIEKC